MGRKQQTIDSTATRGAAKSVKNFVAPAETTAIVPKPRRPLPDQTRHERTIRVTPHATQHIEVKTSAVDQAKAFEIRTRSLAIVTGLGMVVLSTYRGWIELFSVGAIVVFGVTFAGVWLVAYSLDIIVSPGFVTLFEAAAKWLIFGYEVVQTWRYRNRENN